jgi:hypothetical protein
LPNRDVYVGTVSNNKLASRESNFRLGRFRTGITAGYRFNTRLGVEMGVNYYSSNDKTMAQTTNIRMIQPQGSPIQCILGQIIAFDLAPLWFCFRRTCRF